MGNQAVILYPNPAPGPSLNILPPAYTGTQDVRVEIFSSNFRKVQDRTFLQVPSGLAVTVELKDRWERPLANGLYYVIVKIEGGRFISKLMVLR